MSSKVKFKWIKIENESLKEIKRIVACDDYFIIQVLMKYLKFIPMLEIYNWEQLLSIMANISLSIVEN